MEKGKKWLRRLIMLLAIFFALHVFSLWYPAPAPHMAYGVSFDPAHADYLGLDTGRAFATILDDWHFRYIRLGLHWDIVEKNRGAYDFSRFDALMAMAAARGAKVVLVVGQKTPRWPECHMPAWAAGLLPPGSKKQTPEYSKELRAYIVAAVDHYKNSPALEMWQVENEPLFPFGSCPAFSSEELKSEIALVKNTDPAHPVLVTDSGELSTWLGTSKAGDYFGTTLYRVVWNSFTGYVSYDWLPAWFYRAKLALMGRARSSAFVIELQGEPWLPATDVAATPLSEQFRSLDMARLKKNIDFANRVGFARTYLWGAEWWQWLASVGRPEFSEYIKNLPKN